jgi:hypothetical protein
MKDKLSKLVYKAQWEFARRVRHSPDVETVHFKADPGGDESVKICRSPAFIEPLCGYVISEAGVLIEDSMRANWRHSKPPWRLTLPSPRKFRDAIESHPENITHVPRVISLRHWWEWNYYHFYMDVLGKLQLLRDVGFTTETPFAMGRYVREMSFAEQLLQRGNLSERQWMVPDIDNKLIIHADEVIYLQTRQPYRDRLAYLMQEIRAPTPNVSSEERIFVTRNFPANRRLTNESEVHPVLERHGFRTVDTADMSIGEQMDAFAQARYVVALHGAGVTNIIYRQGAPLSVLELHPATYPGPGDMLRICNEYGYPHASLAGTPVDDGPSQHTNYEVDPVDLDRAIRRLVDATDGR